MFIRKLFQNQSGLKTQVTSSETQRSSPIHSSSQEEKSLNLHESKSPTEPILILDLDETLIHTKTYRFDKLSVLVKIPMPGKDAAFYVMPRPGLHEFLSTMEQHYQIYLYTSSQQNYAEAILKAFDIRKFFKGIFHREHCMFTLERGCVKDLNYLGFPFERLVFIDDLERHLKDFQSNSILIESFEGQAGDEVLKNMTPYLLKLAEFQDLRPVISQWLGIVQKRGKTPKFDKNENKSENGHLTHKFPHETPKKTLHGTHGRHLSLTISRSELEGDSLNPLFKKRNLSSYKRAAHLNEQKQNPLTEANLDSETDWNLSQLNDDLDEEMPETLQLRSMKPRSKFQVGQKQR